MKKLFPIIFIPIIAFALVRSINNADYIKAFMNVFLLIGFVLQLLAIKFKNVHWIEPVGFASFFIAIIFLILNLTTYFNA